MFEFIAYIVKYLLFVLFLMLCVVIYKVFALPLYQKLKYSRYGNVNVESFSSQNFGSRSQILNSIDVVDDTVSEGTSADSGEICRRSLITKDPLEQENFNKSYDIKMMHVGKNYISSLPDSKYMLFDIRNISMRVFESLIQDKIDRYRPEGDHLGMIPGNSLPCNDTQNVVCKMRSRIIKKCGIADVTQQIPQIVDLIKMGIPEVNFEEEDWDVDLSHLIFKVLINMLLGRKFEENVEKITTHQVDESMNNLTAAKIADSGSLKTTKSDFIDYYIETAKETYNPFTASIASGPSENLEKIRKAVFEAANFKEPDINCIYHKILQMGKFSKDEITDEILSCLNISFITLCPTIVNAVKELRENPDCKIKLEEELNSLLKLELEDMPEEDKSEGVLSSKLLPKFEEILDCSPKTFVRMIQNCHFLKQVVDETLRLHCPVDGSLLYSVLDDINICKVPIPKGSLLRINFSSLHFDILEWHQPKKFLPERFDPESEYFKKPHSSKNRLLHSFLPFGIGDRNCPGKAMSNLLLKVILGVLVDYI